MKHRTADLEGALLDAAVAMAEGIKWEPNALDGTLREGILAVDLEREMADVYAPSTDWSHGGPIIEREQIELMPVTKERWVASASGTDFNEAGPTPLIAAMRAFVASKLGPEVELP